MTSPTSGEDIPQPVAIDWDEILKVETEKIKAEKDENRKSLWERNR